jgi:hypothetical protein
VRETCPYWVAQEERCLKTSEGTAGEGDPGTLTSPGFAGRIIRPDEDDGVRVVAIVRWRLLNGMVASEEGYDDRCVFEDIDIYKCTILIIFYMFKCTLTNTVGPFKIPPEAKVR